MTPELKLHTVKLLDVGAVTTGVAVSVTVINCSAVPAFPHLSWALQVRVMVSPVQIEPAVVVENIDDTRGPSQASIAVAEAPTAVFTLGGDPLASQKVE